jgi:hypothetical protein
MMALLSSTIPTEHTLAIAVGDNPLGRSGVLAYVSAPGGHGVAMQDAGRTQT